MLPLPVFTLIWCLLLAGPAAAGQIPEKDRRNVEIRHTDFEFELPAYNRRTWQEKADRLRRQVLFSAGLLPLPPRTPLNPQIFGRIEHEDYTVEKVLLETFPGYYLGGNLYRPKGQPGPFPGIVSPHGHWAYGRLENSSTGSVVARCINFARQGYVVFAYDMVGYNDTRQTPHGFGGEREQLWMIGPLGLQTWNSIRALDFVESLSEVDRERLAATGASGGGTQTFLLTAVDERVKVSAPVNMISSIMQGGSVCENAPNLRIDTLNVEIAALAAPRPMLMVSATGDWTRNTPEREFPAMQQLYRLMGAADAVETVQFDAPHNYHQGSREAVYRFFGKHLLGKTDPAAFAEQRYRAEQLSDMLALWGREIPAGAITLEPFLDRRIEQAERDTEALRPRDRATLEAAREAFRERLSLAAMAFPPAANELRSDLVDSLPQGEKLLIGRHRAGDRIPAVLLRPEKPSAAPPTLIVHPEGSAWVMSSAESRQGLVGEILSRGGVVMGVDVFQTARAVAPRDIAGAGRNAERYFTTFHRTADAERIQDVLTALTYLRTRAGAREVNLVGIDKAGLWCYFARGLAGGPIRLAADLQQFPATDDSAYVERFFIPGIRRAGDFRAAAALLGPEPALLSNAGGNFPAGWVRATYAALGAENALDLRSEPLAEAELLHWIAPLPGRR